MLGLGDDFAQVGELVLHQETGGRAPNQPGDADSGGVGAVRRAKGVVDVEVAQTGERAGKLLVVGFFFGMEAQVLQQQDLVVSESEHHLLDFFSDAIGGKADRSFQQLVQPLDHRPQAQLRFPLPLGTAQMRGQDDAGALLARVLQGGQGSADARIVSHLSIPQGNVEVHPDEQPAAGQLQVADGELGHERKRTRRARNAGPGI